MTALTVFRWMGMLGIGLTFLSTALFGPKNLTLRISWAQWLGKLVRKVSNMVKNHCLSKSISDASWYQFRVFLEYFGKVFGRITLAVNPAYTGQECSNCGEVVKKSLSSRTHTCKCGCVMDRDHNAAINILNRGMSPTGPVGTSLLDNVNA